MSKLWVGLWLAFCTRVNSIRRGNLGSKCKLLSRNKNFINQQTGKDQVWIKPSRNFQFDKTQVVGYTKKIWFIFLFGFILYNTTQVQNVSRELWMRSSSRVRTVLHLSRHCLILEWSSTVQQRMKTTHVQFWKPYNKCVWQPHHDPVRAFLECQIQPIFAIVEKRMRTK